jgi:hypothetical protein
MTPARRQPPGPGESEPWQEHWARALGLPDPDPCCLCDRTTRSADCQRWELVRALPRERCSGRPPSRRPGRVVVCKDCCIRELDGHRCVWWDFCWNL